MPTEKRTATAYDTLKQAIMTGELLPGTPLSERALCDTLGVSRTPLREAIKQLAADGLAEISPTRRVRVARITLDEAINMLTVMAALEGLSGEQACQRAQPADMERLEHWQAEMRDAYARRDRAAYFELNQRIHLEILRIAANPTLSEIFHNLNARLRLVRERLNPTDARWQQAVDEHEAMLALLKKRDGKKLRQLMETHLRDKIDAILGSMLAEGWVSARHSDEVPG